MAMFKINGKKAIQSVYLAHAAYENAKTLADAHNGKIGSADGKMLEATFKTSKDAKAFVDAFENAYAKAHKAYAKANGKSDKAKAEPTPAQKPKASKGTASNNLVVVTVDGKQFLVDASALVPTKPMASKGKASAPKKTSSSSKKAPSKAKGKAFDYSVIKGKTNADKNKALHAALVKAGMKDSRTAEYLAIWNARPWAK